MGLQYMEYVPNEKATPIRYPSTANLMVDSDDRDQTVYPLCNDFLITKNQSLMNGFFTRVGTTEVVMEWGTFNVTEAYNAAVTYEIAGSSGDFGFLVGPGFFTVQEVLEEMVANFNVSSATTGITWTVARLVGAGAALTATNTTGAVVSFFVTGTLPLQLYNNGFIGVLGATGTSGASTTFEILPGIADIRPARYVDIVCTQLTNNQSVKDASTAQNVRDVLCRWYFDYDNQNPVDEFGFPILMGYQPFCIRRIFNPPKQIQWQTNVPIGQMAFQLYRNDGMLQPVDASTNFLMTLQASEV